MPMPKKPKKPVTAAIVPAVEAALEWDRGRFPMARDVERAAREAAEKVPGLVAAAAELKVTTLEEHGQAVDALVNIKSNATILDELRKMKGDPFRFALDAVNRLFKPWSVQLGAAEEQVKTKAQTWFLEQRRKAREEEERQRQEERDAQAKLDRDAVRHGPTAGPPPAPARVIPRPTPQPVPTTVRGSSGGSGTMRVKHKAKLTDLDKISRDYLMVDWKAVQAKVDQLERNLGSVPADAIEGFEVYEDAGMAVGRTR
jgi:hypothetical protein